ncbi:MAG: hypothetical protein RL497_292 [Pseudomonadota bacterium]|jgi:outer membrane protein
MPAKRTLLLPLLLAPAFTLTSSAYADVLGLRAGVEYWQADLTGEAQKKTSRDKKLGKPVNFDEWKFYGETYNSIWVNFEHPVPFVPNIRMTYTNIENSRTRTRKITAGSTTYYVKESVSLIFDSIDTTLYYEILDNWLNLDVGLTARSLNGDFDSIQTLGDGGLTAPTQDQVPLKEIVPMLYIDARLDIPFLNGLYVQSVFNGATLQGNTLYDINGRVGYDLDLAVLDIGVYVGYRSMVLKSADLGSLYADAQMEGVMTGLEIHF